ncbi:type IV pilin protein [Kingella denitrificans]|uniref:type IV pilin protein n=1 Tax=Kingella denitrificans TaxID=502 RepID=UPI00288ABD61|nr:prepilin-type N-terminal cleavage/methylation domain-containing protein [Kingella denitrificans]
MNQFTKKTTARGFTLIELMVSIAILAILAMIAYPSFATFVQNTRIENARASMLDAIHSLERQYAQKPQFSTANINDITNEYYDLSFNAINDSSYYLTAKPKSGVFSDSVLASVPMNIYYDSITATFSRCSESGLNSAVQEAQTKKPSTTNSNTGCRPLS